MAWGTPAVTLLIGIGLVAPLRADLSIHIRETYGATSTSRVEHYKQRLWRTDWTAGGYQIGDPVNRRSITVDTALRQYMVVDTPAPAPQVGNPVETIVVEIETLDTGEQRPAFGHTAHHIISTERRHSEHPGQPPTDFREIVTDGWYLDLPNPFPLLSRVGAVATFVVVDKHPGDPMPKIVVRTNGRRPAGLPIWEKSDNRLLEVTDLSEAPLDARLFQPPPGYRRVVRPLPGEPLSWSDRLRLYWQQVLNWLGV